MKKKFEKILKELGFGLVILKYHTYRSDMGCQVFDILVGTPSETVLSFSDSYFVGGGCTYREQEQNKILKQFTDELISDYKHYIKHKQPLP